jgi:hypothetical protein
MVWGASGPSSDLFGVRHRRMGGNLLLQAPNWKALTRGS